jgi:peptide deformylase
MPLPIAQLGQPVLWRKAEPVPPETIPTPEFQQFLDAMRETMIEAGGVGLAAPQVFDGRRVFLAAILPGAEEDSVRIETFINPVVTPLSDEVDRAWEGCLSFRELLVLVPRFRAIRLDYLDAVGVTRSLELTGFPARVVQHEFDHLDGILTIDRAPTRHDIVKASEIEEVKKTREEPS